MSLERETPCRVLVVDDIPDVAQALAAVVKTYGHTVEFVTDARQALEVATKLQPRIVLLDIGMPYISGYELAPLLRNALLPNPVAIVAVTAWGSHQDRTHSKAAGFDEHLIKPAGEKMLAEVLSKYG